MQQPKVLVLVGYGINCDNETQYAFQKAGAIADRVHINEIIDGTYKLEDYQIFFVPGGFSYGDELGAGKVLAGKLKRRLGEQLQQFIDDEKLIGGHCNGAQVLIKSGILPAIKGNYKMQTATLTNNDSGRYEDRWINLKSVSRKCVWTSDLPIMRMPVAHGEGKFYSKEPGLVEQLKKDENDQIALVYVMPDGSPANGKFPYNPNGSIADIAGICDPTGRIFLQMPHPERFTHLTNSPQWTRTVSDIKRERRKLGMPVDLDKVDWEGEGMLIFKSATQHAIEELV
jgi:phosphoribosylformylglycinamidine synthase